MKRVFVLFLALLFLVGCGAEPTLDAPETHRIALITGHNDITDQSFNQATYEVARAWCEERNIPFRYYKPTADTAADRVAMVDSAVAEGYNILLLPGYMHAPTVVECAELYPNVKFIALDVSEADLISAAGTEDYTLPENVICTVYREELAGFMAGYAAVRMGYTHLGFLGGMAAPAVMRFGYGFVQGCDAAAGETPVTVEYVYGNQFFGDLDITAYMSTWYMSMGVEVVFACGASIYTSAAEAAQKVGGKLIGVDVDQAAAIDSVYGEGITITSAMKGLGSSLTMLLDEAVEAERWEDFGGSILRLGLESATEVTSNYVQLPLESTLWTESFSQEDYIALVGELYEGNITVSGDITVEPETSNITVNYHGNIK